MRRYRYAKGSMACSDCHIGRMRQTDVTYFTFTGRRMITVPDFPAWVCDICGKCEYDIHALENLALLLHPPAQPKRAGIRSKGKGAGDSPGANPNPLSSK